MLFSVSSRMWHDNNFGKFSSLTYQNDAKKVSTLYNGRDKCEKKFKRDEHL